MFIKTYYLWWIVPQKESILSYQLILQCLPKQIELQTKNFPWAKGLKQIIKILPESSNQKLKQHHITSIIRNYGRHLIKQRKIKSNFLNSEGYQKITVNSYQINYGLQLAKNSTRNKKDDVVEILTLSKLVISNVAIYSLNQKKLSQVLFTISKYYVQFDISIINDKTKRIHKS